MTDAGARLDLRLVPAALTAWTVTAAGITWAVGPILAVGCAVVGLGWAALIRWRGEWRPTLRATGVAVIGAAVVGAGFALAAGMRNDAVREHPIGQRFGAVARVTVTPGEDPRLLGSGRLMFRATISQLDGAEMSGRAVVFAPAQGFGELMAGQPVRFKARIGRPTRRDLTVAVLNAIDKPTLGRASPLQRAARAVRTRFARVAREVLPPDHAAILPGLVLGDTSAVSATTTREFKTAGLTHLTAVSGANVTIVCGAVLLSARVVGPRTAVGLAALALVAFVVVVQPTASVLRAAVMGAIALVAIASARRRQAIPVLAATVLGLLIVAPELAVDAGFALSVSATAALIVLAPGWSERLIDRGWPKILAEAFCIALAAQLVTAPLVAAISGKLSVIGVLANLAVAVIIPPITVLGTAAAALCWVLPPGAGLLIRFTGPELWWLLHVASTAAEVPGAALTVPSGFGGVATVGGATLAAVALWRGLKVGVGRCRPLMKRSSGERDGGRPASDPR
ncbi:ComEC/Rec2 family competence protein [Mycolicibacterium sp. P1-5]|uniref:ComEC/Rec2 family competence protein n=1 Tax=Mycolicibacterium sp. P1-5 TaxID=2024617 RepID=UPI0011EDEBB6|nr:ComEC/Rec2 family competence protein [Mycolicibacterium sp. P1-5]KAA0100336.1 ComEC family competence protein [Mycolicibacterium sp. P1-5]